MRSNATTTGGVVRVVETRSFNGANKKRKERDVVNRSPVTLATRLTLRGVTLRHHRKTAYIAGVSLGGRFWDGANEKAPAPLQAVGRLEAGVLPRPPRWVGFRGLVLGRMIVLRAKRPPWPPAVKWPLSPCINAPSSRVRLCPRRPQRCVALRVGSLAIRWSVWRTPTPWGHPPHATHEPHGKPAASLRRRNRLRAVARVAALTECQLSRA